MLCSLTVAALLALSSVTQHRVPRLPSRQSPVTLALASQGDTL